MSQDRTSVRIDKRTHSRLASLKEDRENSSYNELLDEMIDMTARVALWESDGKRAEYVDKLTEPLRREVAGLELELGKDGPQSFSQRVESLAGKDPEELRTRAMRLSRERLWDVRGNPLPESETTEEYRDLTEEERTAMIEDMTSAVLGPNEQKAASEEGLSVIEYVEEHYGLNPYIYPTDQHLMKAMSAVRTGPDGLPDHSREDNPFYENSTVLPGVKTAANKEEN